MAEPIDSKTIAVQIASTVLDEDIWFILDKKNFVPPEDGLARYYADELPKLRDKSESQLRKIHETKKLFAGALVRK